MLGNCARRLHFTLSITANRAGITAKHGNLASMRKIQVPCTSPYSWEWEWGRTMQLIVSCAQFPQYQFHHCWKSSSNYTWRKLNKPPRKLSHLLNLTWSYCMNLTWSHIVMGHVFSSKVTPIKYQVTEMHRKKWLAVSPWWYKDFIFPSLRVSHLSWLLSRSCWEMWIYVAKAQANIMKKRILIHTVTLVCLIHCEKNTLEKSYSEAMIYMLTNSHYLLPSENESNVLFLIVLLHWSAKYKPLCHILNWGWLSNIKLQKASSISAHLPV